MQAIAIIISHHCFPPALTMSTSPIQQAMPPVHFSGDESDVVEDIPVPSSSIWTNKEKAVLTDHIQGYRRTPKKSKAAFIVNEVIPKIKGLWDGRYSKRKMSRDSVIKAEWAKKKKVRKHSVMFFCIFYVNAEVRIVNF